MCYIQQRVAVNGVKSVWAPVVSGVSSHINYITSNIESKIRLFANGCVCHREIKNVEDTVKLQKDIDHLCRQIGYEIPTRKVHHDATKEQTD